MTIRYDGRVAVVTGAGAGLGRSHAMLLASRGAKVVVNDPGGAVDGAGGNAAVADQVVKEIRDAGGIAAANYASVADRAGAASIVQQAIAGPDGAVAVDALMVLNVGFCRDERCNERVERRVADRIATLWPVAGQYRDCTLAGDRDFGPVFHRQTIPLRRSFSRAPAS